VILLLHLGASCSTWRTVPGAGLARPEGERLGHARVLLRDGTELELRKATIRPDSIVGFGGNTRSQLSVARSEVARIDRLRPDAITTLVVGTATSVILLFLGTR